MENTDGTLPIPPDKERFIIELEFVQSLANPKYLNFLGQKGYFEDEDFILYLKYLRYWKSPEYMKHLLFPQCLAFLDAILDNQQFRKEIAFPQFVEYVHAQQGLHWMRISQNPSEESV